MKLYLPVKYVFEPETETYSCEDKNGDIFGIGAGNRMWKALRNLEDAVTEIIQRGVPNGYDFTNCLYGNIADLPETSLYLSLPIPESC